MIAGSTPGNWLVPIAALLVAAFAVCTTELIIGGLLPAIAADLSVTIPTAGLLISGYALGVAVAGPALALATTRLPRKGLLLVVMAVFLVGNLLCAVSNSYWMLLAARLVLSACHGLFFGIILVIATGLAPPGRQASAVSLVMAGVNAATIIGIPLGTAIGNTYGWHVPFWLTTVAGAVAAVTLAVLIPAANEAERAASDLRSEFRAAIRPVVLLCFGIIALALVAFFVMVAYLVPFLTGASGIPLTVVPWVMLAMGVAGFFGNLIGGRLGDRYPMGTLIGSLGTSAILFAVLSQMTSSSVAVVLLLCAIWCSGFAFIAPVQSCILREVSDAPNFASTLMSTSFQVGIAAGAALGGAVIAAGWAYAQLPLLSTGSLVASLIGTLALLAWDRQRKPAFSGA
jgi:DHA1 family inner membrane transport protein